MNKKLRIVFMGTPKFAVASLEALLNEGFDVAGVITSPDKPAGRGKKLTESEVKSFAVSKGLPVLQPTNLKNPDFIDELNSLNVTLGIVVAFRMLPEIVWAMPEYGTFNLHASLLPDYRGAAPINHAIINGEKETGVTTFFLKQEIDTGAIIFQEKTPIHPGETAGELHDRLMKIGANLVIKTVKAIQNNDYPQISQLSLITSEEIIKPAPKIFKDDCYIKWDNTAEVINNLIRGLSPYPGAISNLLSDSGERIQIKIFKTSIENCPNTQPPGEIEIFGKERLAVWVKNGKIIIDELQMEGKKRMKTKEFLNGFRLTGKWKMD